MHRRSRGSYGAPRVHHAQPEMVRDGIAVAMKHVARLMREDWLMGRRRRKVIRTTDSEYVNPIASNILARRVPLVDHPVLDRAWCGYMTYIPTREGWLYLPVLIDLSSRRVGSWATGTILATKLPLMALQARCQRSGSSTIRIVERNARASTIGLCSRGMASDRA